ncbi:MAG: 16S rRNA (cytosine(1402)-N(4))-methyltransferase [Chitinophagaceae bacterium]
MDGFKNAVREIVKGNPNKYFAQVFQALRIEVNDELGALKEMLGTDPILIKAGRQSGHHYVSFP